MTADKATGSGAVVNNATLDLAFTAAGEVTDAITGTGTVVNSGTGVATVKSATGNILDLRSGTTLNITSAATGSTFNQLKLAGTGAKLNIAHSAGLDLSGKVISLTLDGSMTNGSTVLDMTGGSAMTVSTGTTLNLSGTPSGLNAGDSIILVDNATGAFTPTDTRSGRNLFTTELATNQLILSSGGNLSFTEWQAREFNPIGVNNSNLIAGAGLLDRLASPGSGIDPALMNKLETLWGNALDLGGYQAALAEQQLQGAASVYATTPLYISSSRFRSLWERRNHSHLLDNAVFAGLSPAYQGNAGVASPDALASPRYGARDRVPVGQSRIWASGFGAWAKQDADANLAGYKYDSYGAALGYEYSFNNCLQLGFAAAYSRGDLKVDDLRYENKPDILNLALYGVYAHQSGVYVQGGLGYGHAWNDYSINMIAPPFGQKKGKYGSDDWSANIEIGYVARLPQDFNLIPSIGLEYDYLRNSGWTETLSNPNLAANQFYSGHDSSLGIPLGLRFNKMFTFGCNGGYVVPEARAQWVYMADKSRPFVNAGYAGAPGSAKMYGVNPGDNYWRLGAGVSGRFNERVDFRVDYDFDTRSGFRGHNVMAAVGVAF